MSLFSKKRLFVRLKEEFPSISQANISFICEALENNTLTSAALWRIQRIVELGIGRKQTTFAGDGFFDQVCDDRETIFPPSPFINTISTLFDGVDDEARSGLDPTSLQFERTDTRSISFLFKTPNPGTTQAIVDKQKSSANFQGWGTSVTSNKLRFVLRNTSAGGGNALITDSTLSIGSSVWEHWVITYAGNSLPTGVIYYKDGGADPSRTTIANNLTLSTISDERFRIGRRSGPSIPFNGNVDQVTIWNKVLSAAEAAEAFNLDTSKQAIELNHTAKANIISHWRMGDSQLFPLIVDQIGVVDLTLINAIDAATSFVKDVA